MTKIESLTRDPEKIKNKKESRAISAAMFIALMQIMLGATILSFTMVFSFSLKMQSGDYTNILNILNFIAHIGFGIMLSSLPTIMIFPNVDGVGEKYMGEL
jgi:hypothetical protein